MERGVVAAVDTVPPVVEDDDVNVGCDMCMDAMALASMAEFFARSLASRALRSRCSASRISRMLGVEACAGFAEAEAHGAGRTDAGLGVALEDEVDVDRVDGSEGVGVPESEVADELAKPREPFEPVEPPDRPVAVDDFRTDEYGGTFTEAETAASASVACSLTLEWALRRVPCPIWVLSTGTLPAAPLMVLALVKRSRLALMIPCEMRPCD